MLAFEGHLRRNREFTECTRFAGRFVFACDLLGGPGGVRLQLKTPVSTAPKPSFWASWAATEMDGLVEPKEQAAKSCCNYKHSLTSA